MHVPIAHIKKNVQKIINTEYYMNLSIHFSLKEKNIPFQKRKRNLQITSHTQRRSILRNKRNTRIHTIQKNRTRKSRNRPNTRSHSTQHQKNRKPLKCNLNLKK